MATLSETCKDNNHAPPSSSWSTLARIGFRFFFVYIGAYILLTQIALTLLGIFSGRVSTLATVPVIRWLVGWTAVNIFGISGPLVHVETASSDRTYDWVLLFCLLITAVAVTITWSVLDRRRLGYPRLLSWFRVCVRFGLAGQLVLYGVAKILLTQMPSPPLSTLMTPFGGLTPMGLLWSSIGAAPAYEVMIGSFETIGGLLLILPKTATLGAFLSTVGVTQVFVLNLTYDVPVKTLSFHLLLMSLFLLAPELGRLLDVLLSRRPVGLSKQFRLFRTRRANSISLSAQIAVGIWIMLPIVGDCLAAMSSHGDHRSKPPLYGAWNVEFLARDNREIPPLLSEKKRWRRVFFEYPGEFKYQRMDDFLGFYRAKVDVASHRLELSRYGKPNEVSVLVLKETTSDDITLSGRLDGHEVEMRMLRIDCSTMPLLKRRFHWVQDYPYNAASR